MSDHNSICHTSLYARTSISGISSRTPHWQLFVFFYDFFATRALQLLWSKFTAPLQLSNNHSSTWVDFKFKIDIQAHDDVFFKIWASDIDSSAFRARGQGSMPTMGHEHLTSRRKRTVVKKESGPLRYWYYSSSMLERSAGDTFQHFVEKHFISI